MKITKKVLKNLINEAIREQEEVDYASLPLLSPKKIKYVIDQLGSVSLQANPMSSTVINNEQDLLRFLLNELMFERVRQGRYKLKGPNDSTVSIGNYYKEKGSGGYTGD